MDPEEKIEIENNINRNIPTRRFHAVKEWYIPLFLMINIAEDGAKMVSLDQSELVQSLRIDPDCRLLSRRTQRIYLIRLQITYSLSPIQSPTSLVCWGHLPTSCGAGRYKSVSTASPPRRWVPRLAGG